MSPWIAAILLNCRPSHGTSTRVRYEIEKKSTKHVQDPRIEGAPSCDVLGVIPQEKIYMALGSLWQHESSEVLSDLRRSAAVSMSKFP
jgi:hypothetical protein